MKKPIIIHLSEEVHQKAIAGSKKLLGVVNVSAYIRSIIIKDNEK